MSDLAATMHEWHLRNHRYVGYVRAIEQADLAEQYAQLESFAKEHGLQIAETFCDIGKPMSGLHHAMEALKDADGLLIVDLNRLVTHTDDRLRDLRPILHHFCAPSEGKHLISIAEGINTATASGQASAMELVKELRDVV
jgi:DNA invertase Pin-like site-specific DNA recombinase